MKIPPPPSRHTDPAAADRAAPGAHGRPSTPTARVYPRGARQRQRVTGTGARGHPTGQVGGEQRRGPPSPQSPPRSPPGLWAAGAPALCPPRGPGDVPPPPEGTVTPGGGRSWIRTPRAPAPSNACSRGGRDQRASPHQRARTTHGARPGAARDDQKEQHGGAAPHDQSSANDARDIARSGRAEERAGSVGPSGGAVHGPPPPPARLARRRHAVSPAGPRLSKGWGGGEEGRVPWSPDAAPRLQRGVSLVVLALGGQPPTGGRTSPRPHSTL